MQIRELTPEDAGAYLRLRQQALASEPLAFLSSPQDDRASSVEAVRELLSRGPDSVIFGAFDEDLVGSVGVYREPELKAAHNAHVWGMYVAPDLRRRGAGRELLLAALEHARRLSGVVQVHLGVTDVASSARRLYESVGFRRWGTEPRYLRQAGRSIDCHHLVLALDHPPAEERAAGAP
jgi:ribosomal protein S18 acetylase RimI-like enzyme